MSDRAQKTALFCDNLHIFIELMTFLTVSA